MKIWLSKGVLAAAISFLLLCGSGQAEQQQRGQEQRGIEGASRGIFDGFMEGAIASPAEMAPRPQTGATIGSVADFCVRAAINEHVDYATGR